MDFVYVIVKNVHGPCGHGEPGIPYLALATDGSCYELGFPHPAFADAEVAEEYRKSFDKYNFYRVIPLEVR